MSTQLSTCEKCRKAGEKLFLKGEKCFGPTCPILKRNFPPGQHGTQKRYKKTSSFGKQLLEKQKAREMYGLREKQFSNYIVKASKKEGDTGEFLINLLESRLDNVVYRLGFASTRKQARQIVNHGLILVNGKKVDIPSYTVKISQEISLKEKAKKSRLFETLKEDLAKKEIPSWLMMDGSKMSGKMLNQPTLDNPLFDLKAIIEFYSR